VAFKQNRRRLQRSIMRRGREKFDKEPAREGGPHKKAVGLDLSSARNGSARLWNTRPSPERGLVAEWLRRGLQILAPGWIPGQASRILPFASCPLRAVHRVASFLWVNGSFCMSSRLAFGSACAKLWTERGPGVACRRIRHCHTLLKPETFLMPDLSNARRVMVDNQIRAFHVTDRDVLAAFETVPRELFRAALSAPLPIPTGGSMSPVQDLPGHCAPVILARLIQLLAPRAGETALDVGAHGHSVAILAAMGLKTSLVEVDSALVEGARVATLLAALPVSVLPNQPGWPPMWPEVLLLVLMSFCSMARPSASQALSCCSCGRWEVGVVHRQGRSFVGNRRSKANGVVGHRFAFDAQGVLVRTCAGARFLFFE